MVYRLAISALTLSSFVAQLVQKRTVVWVSSARPQMENAKSCCSCGSFASGMQPEFKVYIKQLMDNCQALAKTLQEEGFRLVTGGTDNHLVLVDVKGSIGVSGKEAEKALDEVNITVNKNAIPYDTEKPFVTSGIRVGTAAMSARQECCIS